MKAFFIAVPKAFSCHGVEHIGQWCVSGKDGSTSNQDSADLATVHHRRYDQNITFTGISDHRSYITEMTKNYKLVVDIAFLMLN